MFLYLVFILFQYVCATTGVPAESVVSLTLSFQARSASKSMITTQSAGQILSQMKFSSGSLLCVGDAAVRGQVATADSESQSVCDHQALRLHASAHGFRSKFLSFP